MNLNLEKYIPKREKFLINNKYEIIKNKKDDFHCVIYYLSKNKIEIIVRKLNNNLGWDYDLKIKFLEDNYLISIGSCPDNYKIIELYCKFEIKYDHPKDLFYIPKMIIQTNNLMCKNFDHYNTVMTLLEKNPSYDYIFFNDLDARIFIKENFLVNILNTEKKENDVSDVLKAYDMIKPGAIKADLFRYCYLYVHGGVYLDIKTELIMPLRDIFTENHTYSVISIVKDSIYQGIIATPPGNPVFLKLVYFMIKLVELKKPYHYIIFTLDFYQKIMEECKSSVKTGINFNKMNDFNYYLFLEKCTNNAGDCYDGLDKHKLCCNVYHNNKKIIKTRYADFPW